MLPILPLILPLMFGAKIALAALPVTFEENRGQVPPEVAFLSRTAGYRVFLTRQGAVITLQDGSAIRVTLANSRTTTPVGTNRLVAKTNYLTGPDPSRWRRGIANYEGVTYPQAYPGIDVVWHSRGDAIEHDFLVAAGADPRQIRLAFSGAALHLTPEGDLLAGALRFHKPRAYQKGREVECRYELHGHSVRFALGAYDHHQPLTIDPILSFSTFFGGTGVAVPVATALDSAGNIYVLGWTNSNDFPATSGAFQRTEGAGMCIAGGGIGPPSIRGCYDVFITKFSGDGGTLLYATYFGGPGDDYGTALAVSPAGNVYFSGSLASTKWLPQLKALPGQTTGDSASFVAELSGDGSSLVYATALPAPASALAVDAGGAVYLTGSTSYPLPAVNAFQPTRADANLFKTADNGSTWQALRNGLPLDTLQMVAVDPINPQVLYAGTRVPGLYKSTDAGAHWNSIGTGIGPRASANALVIDPHSPQTVYLGVSDPDLTTIYKSNDGGTSWVPSGSGVPSSGTGVQALAIDPANPSIVYAGTVDGVYKSTDGAASWHATGLISSTPPVYHVLRILVDPSNTAIIYAATLNGVMKSNDGGTTWNRMVNGLQVTDVVALAMDPANPQTLYAAVGAGSGPFVTTDGAAHWTATPSSPLPNSFLRSLLVDPVVHTRVWAGTNDGAAVSLDSGARWTRTPLPHRSVTGLAADGAGSIYAIEVGAVSDAFVMKLDATGSNILYSTYLGGSGLDYGEGIAVDTAGRAYVTGETDSADLPVASALQPQLAGPSDAFITVLDPSGSHLVWSTYVGGGGAKGASAIALDAAGNVHIAGASVGNGSQTADAFAAKIKGDGSAVIFSTRLGGSSSDRARSVGADAAGNTYIAGMTKSNDLPTVNAVQPTLAGVENLLVAEFDGQTGAVQYATYLGGSNDDVAAGIAVTAAGDAYVTGQALSHDFPLKNPWQSSYSQAFLAKIAAQRPALRLDRLTDAASYAATVAPGELVSLFGAALATNPVSATQLPLPTQLLDAQVTVNGVAAPLIYASPAQVNAQIPFETQTGTAQVQLTSSAGTTTMTVQVAAIAPAIFTLNQQGTGAGAILHGSTYQTVTDSNPAAAGEFISIYCTGLGAVNPPAQTGATPPDPPPQTVIPVQVSIAGVMAQVLYGGVAPGFPGLYQVNAQVPPGTPSGAQPLQIIQNGVASNTVTVAVQ